MPDVADRAELEKQLARVVAKEQRAELSALLELMGDPPDPTRVPPEFWANGGGKIRAAVEPVLRDIYLRQAAAELAESSIGVDWALVNQQAIEWARKYAFDLVSDIVARDKRLLQSAVSGFFGDTMTMAELEAKLSPAFGPVRAEMIATTEVTRAANEGEQAVVDRIAADNPDMESVDTWQTDNDDRVCKICGPRHGKVRGNGWTENPPAHPRCRCRVSRVWRRRKNA